MELKVKLDKNSKWGFVESFKQWNYMNKGYIEVIVGVTVEGNFTIPYVYRKGEYIPLSTIEKEMGIEKYIKAKKPFYSLMSDGFVVRLRSRVDFGKKEYLPEESDFDVYSINSRMGKKGDLVPMIRVREVPENITTLMNEKLLPELAKCFGDRAVFLRSRLGVEGSKEVVQEETAEGTEE